MKTYLISLLIFVCSEIQAQTVRIAAAADLKFAMPELVTLYTARHPNTKFEVVYGSSGQFFQQISNGAPFDLYFSADTSYPKKLMEQGLISDEVMTYAFGTLVLYSTQIDISKGVDVLKDPQIRKIAIANPNHAPYGRRAKECLNHYGLDKYVQDKLVFGDHVTQTAQFALSGNADVAFIALSVALSPELQAKGRFMRLDTASYKPIEQGCVRLKRAEKNTEALEFLKFVLGSEAKALFEKYGFNIPEER